MHAQQRPIEDFDIVQNVAVGATILWAFVKEYCDITLNVRGVPIPLLMPVLPIAFHRDNLKALATRNLAGGLYRALAEDVALPAGLQRRMEQMADRSMDSLLIALAAGLLSFDPQEASVTPGRRSLPSEVTDDSTRLSLATAKRLGHWFGELTIEQISALLKIRF